MGIELELAQFQKRAQKNNELYSKLILSRESDDPYQSFCKIASEYGYTISVYELADAGQAFCDAMMRSVNGGGRNNFESWTDFYEMFFDELENSKHKK